LVESQSINYGQRSDHEKERASDTKQMEIKSSVKTQRGSVVENAMNPENIEWGHSFNLLEFRNKNCRFSAA